MQSSCSLLLLLLTVQVGTVVALTVAVTQKKSCQPTRRANASEMTPKRKKLLPLAEPLLLLLLLLLQLLPLSVQEPLAAAARHRHRHRHRLLLVVCCCVSFGLDFVSACRPTHTPSLTYTPALTLTLAILYIALRFFGIFRI